MTVTDPVCRMKIEESDAAAQLEYKGKKYYFCSMGCKEEFESNPDSYLTD